MELKLMMIRLYRIPGSLKLYLMMSQWITWFFTLFFLWQLQCCWLLRRGNLLARLWMYQ